MEEKIERTRRHITISDELYKKVSIKAAEKETHRGKIIEEALKKYFSDEQ